MASRLAISGGRRCNEQYRNAMNLLSESGAAAAELERRTGLQAADTAGHLDAMKQWSKCQCWAGSLGRPDSSRCGPAGPESCNTDPFP